MKKNKKKLFSLISYTLCLMLLAGCGGGADVPPDISLDVPSATLGPTGETPTSLPDTENGPGDTVQNPQDPSGTAQNPTDPSDTVQNPTDPSGTDRETPAPDDTVNPSDGSAPEQTTSPDGAGQDDNTQAADAEPTSEPTPVVYRDNTPVCLVPTADGTAEIHNEVASIDYSNAAKGYIMALYEGSCPKVKMQIKCPDTVTYTYNLVSPDFEAFPLSGGNGSYTITILENISGTSYLTCLTVTIDVSLKNQFGPYLYPNQYCKFTSSSKVVATAKKLAATAENDLDVVSAVYNYLVDNITYDYDKAATVPSGYTSNVDDILNSKKGICLDYAAVMASMLRSQRIPTRLVVGYAGDAYHAWISTYIKDVGWVNGIIQFDGTSWELMDPTFAASSSEEELRDFIGDGTNYITKYMY